MDFAGELTRIGLVEGEYVVIGSGILDALGIRSSGDIDLVVSEDAYARLATSGKFEAETNHGRTMLTDETFEIGTFWNVLEKDWRLGDLMTESIIVDSVCYVSLDFIRRAKQSWIDAGHGRPKDVEDVWLIEAYSGS